ncbi:tyrosine-type recombinase/integrase [Pseudoclavibacter alba]|uniref:Tyrosine-type recombinase/integrase n=1 Tax=Pseudoclavibacter albus TaxID=272241 RepID=A0ABT2HW29_9MICO|nr:tyrosine-type recombinase/integrase [Pseudoclavibacter alba]
MPIPAEIMKLVPLTLPEALVWPSPSTRQMRPLQKTTGWFSGAVKRCQANDEHFPRVTPHDLRHTAASLAVSAGANVKVIQRMLGHTSAALTLDQYADLFDDDLDAVAERLNLVVLETKCAQNVPKTGS